jgi:hypothetical protein
VRHESESYRQRNNCKIDRQACAGPAALSLVTKKTHSCDYSKRMDQDCAQDGD